MKMQAKIFLYNFLSIEYIPEHKQKREYIIELFTDKEFIRCLIKDMNNIIKENDNELSSYQLNIMNEIKHFCYQLLK